MIEEKVTVGKNTAYPLNGILTLPEGLNGKVSAVVMVHGSGAADMNEHVGKCYPFRDIAKGLADRGVASLRYDKRTFVHGRKMMKETPAVTVREETIEDAVLALEILKQDERIDHERIFVLGHSMGGMLAPRIDAESSGFAGLIIMAGSLRTMNEILIFQLTEIAAHSNFLMKWILNGQIRKLQAKFAGLSEISDEEARNTKLSGATLYYFKEMNDHPASSCLENCTKPILIMQGGMDAQVKPEIDFAAYQELLKDRENVTFRYYDSLNHLFIPSVNKDLNRISKDYAKGGHIPSFVTDDIAMWINSAV